MSNLQIAAVLLLIGILAQTIFDAYLIFIISTKGIHDNLPGHIGTKQEWGAMEIIALLNRQKLKNTQENEDIDLVIAQAKKLMDLGTNARKPQQQKINPTKIKLGRD